MTRTEDPREEAEAGTETEGVPEQRQRQRQEHTPPTQEEKTRALEELAKGIDPVPHVAVLGRMDGQIAVKLGWRKGMIAISNSRLRFLQNDLGMDILDNEEDYLF